MPAVVPRNRSKLARRSKCVALAIVLAGDSLPTEFRIFTAGEVETVKGTFVFDAAAAESVMAEYKTHGIELMVDYDHASLGSVADPALAGRAAGWFEIEVRNGELWAVNVRWTPDAAAALQAREWRFMSPAFQTDGDRIVSLMNVALTNLPATRNLQPLMAASAAAPGENAMTVEEFLKVLKALGIDPSTSLDDAIAKIQGKDADANTEDAPPPAGDGGADETTEMASDGAPAEDKKKDAPAEVAASVSRLFRLTGANSLTDAVSKVDIFRASHLELETERKKLSAERETLESAERRKGCVDLVTLAGRAPATVWLDDKAAEPKKYLSAMPIADFREYVKDAIKAHGGGKSAPRTPTKSGAISASSPHGLDEREMQMCKDANCDPAVFAELKARREAAKNGRS